MSYSLFQGHFSPSYHGNQPLFNIYEKKIVNEKLTIFSHVY